MTDDERIEELAGVIYSQCGVSIRNDESYTIAQKLVELGYKRGAEAEE